MEAWNELYLELAEKVNAELPHIQWVDLWHDQISYLTDELPFPVPALFFAFRTLEIKDKGLRAQDCDTQIDMYLYYETFSDTYDGAYNQASALDFLSTLTEVHKVFHGKSGANHGTMRRVHVGSEESGGSGNLYRISFQCLIFDNSAQKEYELQRVNEVEIERVTESPRPTTQDDDPMYVIG